MKKLLALQLVAIYAVCLAATTSMAYAEETKDVTANGKKMEVRVPKSAHVDCKDKANAEKIECKKPSKVMPKIEKPADVTAPVDKAPAKK
jgi:hypothetical protein